MNEEIDMYCNTNKSAGLRAGTLALMAIALVPLQWQAPAADAAAATVAVTGSPPVLQVDTPFGWEAGESSVIHALLDYTAKDERLAVTVDWGDGYRDQDVYQNGDTTSGGVTFQNSWEDEDLTPGDTVGSMWARHVYGQPGDYPVTVTVVNDAGLSANYSLTATVAGVPKPVDPTTSPAAQLIHYDITTHTYGETVWVRATGGDSGNPVTFTASPSSVCKETGPNGMAIKLVGAGQCSVVASQAGSADYLPARGIGEQFTVQRAPLVIKANDTTVSTGDPSPAFTATYDGFVNHDTPAQLTMLRFKGPGPNAGPGRYPIAVSASDADYTITTVDGWLTFNPTVTLRQQGLPSSVDLSSVLVFDKAFVPVPFTREVSFGPALHTFYFVRAVWDANHTDVYVTLQNSANTIDGSADVTHTALYSTIPNLIAEAAKSDNLAVNGPHARVVQGLIKTWYRTQSGLGASSSTVSIRQFADYIRLYSDHLTQAGAARVIAHLQVLYRMYGGVGSV